MQQIAILVLSPFGGIWADRFDRRKTMVVTQILSVILTLVLAGVVWSDNSSAIAFSGGMQNAGRMIGPTIARLLLVYFSEAFCFVVNAAAKCWLIGSLLRIHAAPQLKSSQTANVWASIADGARYTWSLKPLRYLLPMVALMSFCITPYQALMPIFAAEVFSRGASMLGFLVGAAGGGGIIGMVYLAARPRIRGLLRWAASPPAPWRQKSVRRTHWRYSAWCVPSARLGCSTACRCCVNPSARSTRARGRDRQKNNITI